MMQRYLVGGAVRDRLLGLPIKDRDWVVTGATPEEMLAAGFTPVGQDFPVFLHPQTHEEHALARTERKSGRGYKGFEFFASPEVTLEDDLARRDLTINAIAQAEDGTLIDPYGGQQDLAARRLHHVSPAFREDPLRVLRVARFAARYAGLGFEVATDTLALMREIREAGELEYLTPERVWQEFEKALGTQSPLVFLQVLQRVDATTILFPELAPFDFDRLLPVFEQTELQQQSSHWRLAILLTIATEKQELDAAQSLIRQLCNRLRIPNRYRDMALVMRQWGRALAEFCEQPAEIQLDTLAALQLLRHPEKLTDALSAALLMRQKPEQQKILEPIIKQRITALQAVEPKTLLEEGFSGKSLGEELRRRQLMICREPLKD